MQFHGEEIPHFPNWVTEQKGFFWQTIHDKRSGVKIIQQDPKNFNISGYGNTIVWWLWKFVTKSASYRVKGQGVYPELRKVICCE